MTNPYEKTLAAYMDLGSIYSFGYGAMRQRFQTFHDNLCEAEDLLEGFEQIISAVEFRTAELAARRLMEGFTVAVVEADKFVPPVQAATPSPIYDDIDAEDNIISK